MPGPDVRVRLTPEGAENVKKALRDVGAKAALAASAAAAAGAAALSALVKSAIDSADAFGKMAQGAGVAVDVFSELNHAANLAGVTSEGLATALAKLNKNIVDASTGTGEGIRAFDALGIAVRNADGTLKSADEVMAEVADKFAELPDSAEKSTAAVLLFGEAGRNMIPMLNSGSAGLREMREEARLLGLSINDSAAKAAEHFNDQLTRLVAVKQGFANTVMQAVLPALNSFTDEIVASARNTDAMRTAADSAATAFKIMLTGLVGLAAAARVAGDSVAKIARAFQLLAVDPGEAFLSPYAAILSAIRRGGPEVIKLLSEDTADMASVLENAATMIEKLWADVAKGPPADSAKGAQSGGAGQLQIQSAAQIAAALKQQTAAAQEAAKAEQALEDLLAKNAMVRLQRQEEADRQAEAAAEAERERLLKRIEDMQTGLLSEEELLRASHERKLEDLQKAEEAGIQVEGGYKALREQLEAQHMDKLVAIRNKGMSDIERFSRMSLKDQTKTMAGMLADMTATAARESRAMFAVNKAASLANAIVKGWESIQNAYAFGSKFAGPVGGAIAAGIAAAATAANVRAISRQSFDGGGTIAPSVAARTPAGAIPVAPVTGAQQAPGTGTAVVSAQPEPATRRVDVHLHGRVFDRETMSDFVRSLNEFLGDGGTTIRVQGA